MRNPNECVACLQPEAVAADQSRTYPLSILLRHGYNLTDYRTPIIPLDGRGVRHFLHRPGFR